MWKRLSEWWFGHLAPPEIVIKKSDMPKAEWITAPYNPALSDILRDIDEQLAADRAQEAFTAEMVKPWKDSA